MIVSRKNSLTKDSGKKKITKQKFDIQTIIKKKNNMIFKLKSIFFCLFKVIQS